MSHGWRFAWRSLARNRRRNLATALAIALGYAGLVLMGGYASRIERFLRTSAVYLQHTGHVVVYRAQGLERVWVKPSQYSLPPDLQQVIVSALAADPRVEFTGRYLRGQGLAGNGCRTSPFLATGLDVDTEGRILAHPEVQAHVADFARPVRGRTLADARDIPDAIGVSLGLARLLQKPKVHDEFTSGAPLVVPECGTPRAAAQIASDANVQLAGLAYDGGLSAVDGEIVSLFHTASTETEDQTVVAPLETLQRLYATDTVTYVAAWLHEASDAAGVAADLRASLATRGIPASVYTYEDYDVNPYYVGSMQFIVSLVFFIGLLVVSVVVLGVFNATTLTVFERTREIGTFRALGYRRGQITALFLREVLLLSAVSIAGGIVLAYAVAFLVNAADIRFTPPGVPGSVQLLITPNATVCFDVAVALLPLSLLATWLVVRRRVRVRTADLLTATMA
jgi:putative ABC transport system permease protein